MRVAGTLLVVLCVIQQWGATCSHCVVATAHVPPATLGAVDHDSCCHQEHSPADQEPPSAPGEMPSHLCSTTHDLYPPPSGKVDFQPFEQVDWVALWNDGLFNPPVTIAVVRHPFSFTQRRSQASLRAQLQVFQL